MAEQFDLIAIGHAIMDIVRTCDDAFLRHAGLHKGGMTIAESPEQIAALAAQLTSGFEVSGGSAANVAVGMASFGGRAAFVGRVAEDTYGRMFRHDIRGTGVVFDAPSVALSAKGTSHALVLVTPDGTRTMLTHLGCSAGVDTHLIDGETIANCRMVYLEGYLFDCPNAKAMLGRVAAMARAKQRKIAFCLPATSCIDRHRAAMLSVVRDRVDVLFANEKEILSLYRVHTLDEALKRVGRDVGLAVVTRSAHGAIVVTNGQRTTMPAEKVANVVDSTGAGDMYAAGFLYGWLRQGDVQLANRLGSFAAAEIITVSGARPEVRLGHLAKMRGLLDEVVA
ncbi:MAG: adenosine kinase [Hyphomicrobiaceae bacterium]